MGGYISRRWEMACLLLSGLVILYTLRVNMSVAAQKMKVDLDWTELEKGYVLSSFYWGYVIGQIPASCIAQYHGAKWLFCISVAVPSFLTILVPMACTHSLAAALTVRVLIGFFESASFPAIYHFFPIWVPNSEKTFMIPFIISGIYLGEIVGFSFSGELAESSFYIHGDFYGGWQSIFYVFGLCGLLWCPLWIYAAYESPSVHPYITQEELEFMRTATSLGMLGAREEAKTESLDDLDIECITFDNLHRPSTSTSTAQRAKAGLHYLRSAVVGGGSKNGLPSAQYNRVSGNDASGGGSALTGRTPTSPGDDEMELSPIHSSYKTDSQGYRSIDHLPRDGRGQAKTEFSSTVSPLTAAQAVQSSSAQDDDGDTGMIPAPVSPYATAPFSRAQDEEEMVLARIELATRTPWKEFLTHPVALCLLAANFQYGWMNFTLMSEMPSFFTDVLGFDLRSAGVLCIFPYLALFVAAIFFGKLFSYLEHEAGWHVTNVRRAAQFIAYFCSGVTLILCGYAGTTMGAYSMMILTLVFFGANQSGLGCVWTDIAPNYSSTLNSLGNTIGAIAGILGPIIVAACTDAWPEHGYGWRVAFFITFALSCVTLALWFLTVKAEILPVLNSPRPSAALCG